MTIHIREYDDVTVTIETNNVLLLFLLHFHCIVTPLGVIICSIHSNNELFHSDINILLLFVDVTSCPVAVALSLTPPPLSLVTVNHLLYIL